jgi:hypothetical protein
MNANTTVNQFSALGIQLLGILLVICAVAFILGVKLPFITSYRVATIILLVAGLVVCSIGGLGRVSAANAWFHPISILGYLVGVLILIIAGASLIGKQLPMINGERASFMAFTGLIILKMILTQLHPLIR